MKIYLSTKENENKEYTQVTNIVSLENMALDSEVTSMVVDCFLCGFSLKNLDQVIDKILKKMRLNSDLTIIDKDIDILCLKHNRDEISLDELNSLFFSGNHPQSFLTLETVEKSLQNKISIVEKLINNTDGSFIIKGRRLK